MALEKGASDRVFLEGPGSMVCLTSTNPHFNIQTTDINARRITTEILELVARERSKGVGSDGHGSC